MTTMSAAAIWHDTECGSYTADLGAWRELASASSGGVLELGSGTGRVALHLARRGHEVWGVDRERELVEVLEERGAAEGLPVRAIEADARRLELDRGFDLAIAPMQFVQMVGDERERDTVLRRAAAHLERGGRLAAALLDGVPHDLDGAPAPLPDVRELRGRVYCSVPVDVAIDGDRLELRRLRQIVSPSGELTEQEHAESLRVLDPEALEEEGEAAGLRPRGRIAVPAADGYVGSVIVVLERS